MKTKKTRRQTKFFSTYWELKPILLLVCFIFSQSMGNTGASSCRNENNARYMLAKELDFVQLNNHFCSGYYFEPIIASIPEKKIHISSEHGFISKHKPSVLSGNVIVNQKGKSVKANKAVIFTNAKTKEIEKIELFDNVKIREKGKLLIGTKGFIDTKKKLAHIENAAYRINLDKKYLQNNNSLIHQGNVGWGQAKSITSYDNKKFELHNANFSTCPPTQNIWSISSKKTLIKQTYVSAYHSVFRIKTIPVFYLPYISFPVNKDRKSGFLAPTYGKSSFFGHVIELPYYFNLAPNYDLTVTPKLYSKRGVMFSNEFRYLTPTTTGNVKLVVLPFDSQFAKQPTKLRVFNKHRGSINFSHNTHFNRNWSANVQYNVASDDDYIKDFHNTSGNYQSNQLLRQGDLQYSGDHWYLLGRLQSYQTLHPQGILPITNVYDRLPTIIANANYPRVWSKFDFEIKNEFSNFQWPTTPPNNQWSRVIRTHTNPSLSYTNDLFYGPITPRISLWYSYYDLYHNALNKKEHCSVISPIISVATNATFSKTISFASGKLQHQMIPKLKYVYIPYSSQTQLPLIDSNYQAFNYKQLFRENRFIGLDRLGDTNHISFGISSKLSNQYNYTIIETGIGQIAYFAKRKTTMINSLNENKFLGYIPNKEKFSPIAGFLNFNPSKHLALQTDAAWHFRKKELFNARANLQIKSHLTKPLNINYSFIKNGDPLAFSILPTANTKNLHQINTSMHMPLGPNWHVYGSLSYNINAKYFRSYFAGLEYNNCCWATRILAGKFFVALNNNNRPIFNRAIYLQIVLKGVGYYQLNNVQNLLQNHISGFKERITD